MTGRRGRGPVRTGWGAFVLGLAALAGCGGGGGGGGGSADGGTGTTNPAATALALTPQNMGTVAYPVLSVAELGLQLGQLAVEAVRRFQPTGSALSLRESCANGGIWTATVQDGNGDGRLSTGDRLVIEWRDCGVPLMGVALAGRATVDLGGIDLVPTEGLRGSLIIGSDGLSLQDTSANVSRRQRVAGSLAFAWTAGPASTALRVTSSGADDLTLQVADGTRSLTDAYRRLDLGKTVRFDLGRTITTLALRVDSERLGGSLSLSTPAALQSDLNTYPETGRLELRGAGTAVVRLSPNFVTDSPLYQLALDANDDGTPEATLAQRWLDAVRNHLFWDGVRTPAGEGVAFQTLAYSAARLDWALQASEVPTVNPVVRLQLTRPLAEPLQLTGLFRDNGNPANPGDAQRQDVAAVVETYGALSVVRPATPLRHERAYLLEMNVGAGSFAPNPPPLRDALGNVLSMPRTLLVQLLTPDTLRAVIGTVGGLLDGPSASLRLSGAGSISKLGPIASYRWTQRNGTPLSFSATDTAETTVRWGATPPQGLETVTLRLTVTDRSGASEYAEVTISSLAIPATGRLLVVRGPAGEPITQGRTTVLIDDGGGPIAGSEFGGALQFSYFQPPSFWNWSFASADGRPLQVGSYENAVRTPFRVNRNGLEVSGEGRGCSEVFGRFDVLELERDVFGAITRLAIDFEQRCESAQAPPLVGSFRINSTRALRQP